MLCDEMYAASRNDAHQKCRRSNCFFSRAMASPTAPWTASSDFRLRREFCSAACSTSSSADGRLCRISYDYSECFGQVSSGAIFAHCHLQADAFATHEQQATAACNGIRFLDWCVHEQLSRGEKRADMQIVAT